jgi:hypothetical protein
MPQWFALGGLRVLVRLGFIEDDKSYARMYRASAAIGHQLPAKIPQMQQAHLLLHRHGTSLCIDHGRAAVNARWRNSALTAAPAQWISPDRMQRALATDGLCRARCQATPGRVV